MTEDERLIVELLEVADETSRLARRATELALRVDQLAGLIAERWQPAVLDWEDERDRREIAAARRTGA